MAPDFTADAVVNGEMAKITLSGLRGRYVVLFFYPLDFTFVCPTELHAFQHALPEFRKRLTEILAVSVDSKFSHLAWWKTPKSQGGIEGIEYPLVSDLSKDIARNFDVLSPGGVAYRGLFLIDKDGLVKHQVVNDLPLGRSVDETLRMVDALQHAEKYGEVCPANWKPGKKAMRANPDGLKEWFAQ
jgi:peroxiredoxin (alkyl hydroperoxide reductase subunit C)